MFWGWGRILGSILGGPLGTLGRPPGACKAKSVSRVCFNSVDAAHEEDNEKGKHVPECHQAAVQQPANLGGQWIRSFHLGTAFLNAGYDLMRSHHQPVSPDRSQGLTVIELFQADKNNSGDHNKPFFYQFSYIKGSGGNPIDKIEFKINED